MSNLRLAVVVAMVVFVFSSQLPAALAASPATEEPPLGSTRSNPFPSPGVLSVLGANGYRIYAFSQPARGGEPSKVYFAALGRDADVYYGVPGKTLGEGMQANFGRVGRIDMRWRPDGRVNKVTVKCKTYRYHAFFAGGSYVGTLRFRGIGSFTHVAAHRVSGRTGWRAFPGCEFRTRSGFPGPGKLLAAERRPSQEPEGSERSLDVIQNRPGDEVSYEAREREEIGRLTVRRSVSVTGGRRTLSSVPSFRSASIRPPRPFHGGAEFERRERALGSWRGDLTVDFPDVAGVPFAGDDWEASFQSGFSETESLSLLSRPALPPPLALPAWPSTKR